MNRMTTARPLVFMLLMVFSLTGRSLAATETSVEFLSKAEAARTLAADDDFMTRISPFDMSSRMKTDKAVSKSAYIEFIADNTLDWTQVERSTISAVFDALYPKMMALNMRLPEQIQFIKTTGLEEGGAAYTRGNAIIMQQRQVANVEGLASLMAHEILHVFSRNNPDVKEKLYNSIGFYKVGDIDFPTELRHRKITNPDAPMNDFAIAVNYQDESLWVVPILFSSSEQYSLEQGGEFFEYLKFKFVVLGEGETPDLQDYDPNRAKILAVSDVKGFFEQVGRNTNYILHPEEIIADNFALLMTDGSDLKSPEVLIRIKQVLSQ